MTFFGRSPLAEVSERDEIIAERRRLTILFISPVVNLKGGAERVLLDLLDNPAIRPALAVPGEGELADLAGLRGFPLRFFDLGAVASVNRPPRPSDLMNAAGAGWQCARQLARAVADTGASVVHTNGLKVHVIGALIRLLTRVPVVAHLHDIPNTSLENAIWRSIAASVSRTIIVSRPCFPGATLPYHVGIVMNGVRLSVDMPKPRTLSATPTIGFVGRIHPFKGLHLLLDWFEQVKATRPELRLLIRGRADDEGAEYWQSLQGQISSLSSQGRCRVLGWTKPGEDPYEGIDLLAVPSPTPDPSPLVILEAMSRGIPAIGYPSGGIPALIGAPEHGALAADAEQFETALRRLLESAVYYAASTAAARRVRHNFTIEHFWHNINAQYALCEAPSRSNFRPWRRH